MQTCSWVNIDLVDYQDNSFSFFTLSPQDVAKFEAELGNNKRETLTFAEEEKKGLPG